jgi:hypothetical protein
MKIKRFLYTFLIMLIFIGYACEKSAEDINSSVPLLMSMTLRINDTVNYLYSFNYTNSKIRDMLLTSTIGSTITRVRTEYNYPSNDSIVVEYYNADVDTLIQRETYLLDGAGLAYFKYLRMENVSYSYTYMYYDDASYLIKDSTISTGVYQSTEVNTYTVLNENISNISQKAISGFGTSNSFSDYTFLTSKMNTIGNLNQGVTFMGKQNKNPVASITFNPDPFYGSNPLVYTYEFDEQGRITKATTSNLAVWTYRYF